MDRFFGGNRSGDTPPFGAEKSHLRLSDANLSTDCNETKAFMLQAAQEEQHPALEMLQECSCLPSGSFKQGHKIASSILCGSFTP